MDGNYIICRYNGDLCKCSFDNDHWEIYPNYIDREIICKEEEVFSKDDPDYGLLVFPDGDESSIKLLVDGWDGYGPIDTISYEHTMMWIKKLMKYI